MADVPDAVEHRTVALIGRRQPVRVGASEIVLHGERHERAAADRLALLVVEPRQRIGPRGLPVVAQALRERRLQRTQARVAVVVDHRNRARAWPGEQATVGVRERVVGTGRGVERQVRVVDDVLLVTPLRLHVVDLQRHGVAELVLEADRAVPAAGHVHQIVGAGRLLERVQQTRSRTAVVSRRPGGKRGRLLRRIAEQLQRLIESRQRLAIERVGRKVRATVVGDLDARNLRVVFRPERIDGQAARVEDPGSAPDNGPVVQLVGKPEARLEGVPVTRAVRREVELRPTRRSEPKVVRPLVEEQIVADAEIQRQPR